MGTLSKPRPIATPVRDGRARPGGDEAVLAERVGELGDPGEQADVVGVDELTGLALPLGMAVVQDPHRAQPDRPGPAPEDVVDEPTAGLTSPGALARFRRSPGAGRAGARPATSVPASGGASRSP